MQSHRSLDLALIALFAVILSAPSIAWITLGSGADQRLELRTPTKWSDVESAWDDVAQDPSAVAATLRSYVSDHFGMRNLLLRGYSLATVRGLGVTSTDGVILGKNGWAFLASDGAWESALAVDPFTHDELQIVVDAFVARHQWLADRGVTYILMSAPNKHTVYPDLLPTGFARANAPRLDQLVAALADTPVRMIDLRPRFAAARRRAPLYDPLGTHWNAWGAFLGYRALADAIEKSHPGASARRATDYRRGAGPGGDRALASMLGALDSESPQTIRLEPRFERRALDDRTGLPFHQVPKHLWHGQYSSRNPEVSGPHVVLLRDSFGEQLWPYFAETFPRVDYFWPRGIEFPASIQNWIEKHQPDVVVQEFVERHLEGDVARQLGPLPTDAAARANAE